MDINSKTINEDNYEEMISCLICHKKHREDKYEEKYTQYVCNKCAENLRKKYRLIMKSNFNITELEFILENLDLHEPLYKTFKIQ
jgi:hypothetical protein